jgi:hypothetical protein
MHANIIETSRLFLSQTNCDIPLSICDWEFEAAAKSLNWKFAPGEDGISAGSPFYKTFAPKDFECLLSAFFS